MSGTLHETRHWGGEAVLLGGAFLRWVGNLFPWPPRGFQSLSRLWVIFKVHSRPPFLSNCSGFTRLLNFLFHYRTNNSTSRPPASPLGLCRIIHTPSLKRNISMRKKKKKENRKEWKQISNPNILLPVRRMPLVSPPRDKGFSESKIKGYISGLREQTHWNIYPPKATRTNYVYAEPGCDFNPAWVSKAWWASLNVWYSAPTRHRSESASHIFLHAV